MNKIELEGKLIDEYEKVSEKITYHIGKLIKPNSMKEKEMHEKMKINYETKHMQIKQLLNRLTDDNTDEIFNEFGNL